MPWEFIMRALIFALLAPMWWRVVRLADNDPAQTVERSHRQLLRALSQAIVATLFVGALFVAAPLFGGADRGEDPNREMGLF